MVIDSHALLWWIEGGQLLSQSARVLTSRIGRIEGEFLVSHVTFWELRYKEVQGRLPVRREITSWPEVLSHFGNVRLVETSLEIWLLAAELKWAHRDPADRIIAATALIHGVSVLTKDRVFHAEDSPVRAMW